jgi:glycosyltransferase involved in cell wall biosynthesis
MPHICGCAASITAQTHQDHEHLVQDAKSTDGTAEWLRGQKTMNWISESDSGMYDAIQRGWQRADGDVLSWLNSDEQYLPGTMELVNQYLDTHPEADAVYGNYLLITQDGTALAARREIPLRPWYVSNSVLYAMTCTMFSRRRVIDKFGPPDASYRIVGDYEWVLRLVDAGVRFHHIPEYLALFSVAPSNMSLAPDAQQERALVERAYAHLRGPLPSLCARVCRCTEKLLRGCYGTRHVQYTFYDTSGAHQRQTRVGTRWRWCLEK